MKRTMKQLCDGKVWRAVEAMITGLEEQSKREDFKIDMRTFGTAYADLCYGCAATCAVQKLTKYNYCIFTIDHRLLRATSVNVSTNDLTIFENAIDQLREGSIRMLFLYFGKDIPRCFMYVRLNPKTNKIKKVFCLPPLVNKTWQDNLHAYRVFLRYLKALDI